MDRIKFRYVIAGKNTNLQLDKKNMPGEPGPSFMMTIEGCFRGYISKQKNGIYKALGPQHFTGEELLEIGMLADQAFGSGK